MKALHIAPSDSAGGSLRAAVRESGRDDDVLAFRDDLSCGPIDPDSPASRAKWWLSFSYDETDSEQAFREFWDRIATTNHRLVVWFGRRAAQELAFYHAFADRLGQRPYEIVDVTGFTFPFTGRDGSQALSVPMPAVGTISVAGLKLLLGSERTPSQEMRKGYAEYWRQLKVENAFFRVVTDSGLASAPKEHFDHLILERLTDRWQSVFRIINETIGYNSEPYLQTGDVMLLSRIVALIDEGQLLAQGDISDPRNCRIRLPA